MKKILLFSILLFSIIGCYVYFNTPTNGTEKSVLSIANIEALSTSEQRGWSKDESIILIDESTYVEGYFLCCLYEETICYPNSGSLKTCESKSSRKCDYIEIKNQDEHTFMVDHIYEFKHYD